MCEVKGSLVGIEEAFSLKMRTMLEIAEQVLGDIFKPENMSELIDSMGKKELVFSSIRPEEVADELQGRVVSDGYIYYILSDKDNDLFFLISLKDSVGNRIVLNVVSQIGDAKVIEIGDLAEKIMEPDADSFFVVGDPMEVLSEIDGYEKGENGIGWINGRRVVVLGRGFIQKEDGDVIIISHNQ